MKGTIALLAVLALPATAQPFSQDDLLAKLCPAWAPYTLDADETAILNVVATHYRRFEWSSARAREEGTFIAASSARHAVPSLASAQVLLLNTMRLPPELGAAWQVEFQRHGVAPELAAALSGGLRSRNQTPLTLHSPNSNLLPLSCRELMSMAYAGAAPPKGDFKNVSRAISIALPAFDASRKKALLLSVNDLESVLEGITEDLELTLLHTAANGTWQIEWHTDLERTNGSGDLTRVTAEDYSVFDAVLAHLAQSRFQGAPCVAVVNQTRGAPDPPPGIRPAMDKLLESSAASDLRNRSTASVYIGTYAPKRAVKLVQREALGLTRENDLQGCTGAVRFSLPGYAETAAVIGYTLITVTGDGDEQGEGLALLTRTESGWRVTSDSYDWQVKTLKRQK